MELLHRDPNSKFIVLRVKCENVDLVDRSDRTQTTYGSLNRLSFYPVYEGPFRIA